VVDVMFPTGFSLSNFDFTVSSGSCANDIMAGDAVPVPAPLLLLGSGLLGLGLMRYRKKAAPVDHGGEGK
jgi:hypothetical protein